MNPYLQKAIDEASKFATKPVSETGFTVYSGNSQSDKEYLNLFNILINLNLQIFEKLGEIGTQQKFDKELEKL